MLVASMALPVIAVSLGLSESLIDGITLVKAYSFDNPNYPYDRVTLPDSTTIDLEQAKTILNDIPYNPYCDTPIDCLEVPI